MATKKQNTKTYYKVLHISTGQIVRGRTLWNKMTRTSREIVWTDSSFSCIYLTDTPSYNSQSDKEYITESKDAFWLRLAGQSNSSCVGSFLKKRNLAFEFAKEMLDKKATYIQFIGNTGYPLYCCAEEFEFIPVKRKINKKKKKTK